jgi:hypothetical protein
MEHRPGRLDISKARRLEERGAAIAGLLDVLDLNATLLPRLLAAGHRARVWHQPLFWDPRTGQRRSLVATRGSPG